MELHNRLLQNRNTGTSEVLHKTKKSALYQHSQYSVLSIFQGKGVDGFGADNWETRKIQNFYFIKPRTKNQTVIYSLYR
jgi:hypothetical protein